MNWKALYSPFHRYKPRTTTDISDTITGVITFPVIVSVCAIKFAPNARNKNSESMVT
jgi:hypothetical protein